MNLKIRVWSPKMMIGASERMILDSSSTKPGDEGLALVDDGPTARVFCRLTSALVSRAQTGMVGLIPQRWVFSNSPAPGRSRFLFAVLRAGPRVNSFLHRGAFTCRRRRDTTALLQNPQTDNLEY